METFIQRLRIIALGLFAIAFGIYVLNFIGTRFFYVMLPLYYALLTMTALLYVLCMVGAYKGYQYLKTLGHFVK